MSDYSSVEQILAKSKGISFAEEDLNVIRKYLVATKAPQILELSLK
jgi:hypothetical protein